MVHITGSGTCFCCKIRVQGGSAKAHLAVQESRLALRTVGSTPRLLVSRKTGLDYAGGPPWNGTCYEENNARSLGNAFEEAGFELFL